MFRTDRLPEFYADLVRHGFQIGVTEQRKINELILGLHAADAFPAKSSRVCSMFAAVLCSSQEQSLHFRQRFELIFGADHAIPFPTDRPVQALPAQGASADQGERASFRREQAQLERKQLQFRLVLSLILLLVILVGMPWLIGPRSAPGLKVTVQAGRMSSMPASSASAAAAASAPAPAAPASFGMPRPRLHGEFWVGVAVLLAVFAPFALLALWAASPSRRQSAFLTQRTLQGTPYMVELLVASNARGPFEHAALVPKLQTLRRPVYVETRELDPEATLEASLRNHGEFTPRYARRALASEYLILIERTGADDHSAALATSLVTALASAHVYVDVYYFASDIRRLFSTPNSPRVSLEEVLGRYGRHRLVLITNGNSLLDPVSGTLQNWAGDFADFEQRVLLTPTPAALWGYRELALSTALHISVLPLLPESVPAMVRLLSDRPQGAATVLPASDGAGGSLDALADVLEQSIATWRSTSSPPHKVIGALERGLREAFTPEGLRWLTACAVYPELKWNLTLHIGASLSRSKGGAVVDAQQLLRLALLPWFREGRMPQWLRAHLLAALNSQDYVQIRALYNKLLTSTFQFSRKNTRLNIAVAARDKMEDDGQDLVAKDRIVAEFASGLTHRERTFFRVAGTVTRRLLAGMSRRSVQSRRLEDDIREALADADALNATIAQADVRSLIITMADDSEFADQACFRRVVGLADSAGNPVEVSESLLVFIPTGKQTALLLNEAAAWRLQQRSRTSLRIAVLNFAFVAVAALWFSDSILQGYPAAVAVLAVCVWLVLPYALAEAILVRRLNQGLERFPKFMPEGTFAHKARRFALALPAA